MNEQEKNEIPPKISIFHRHSKVDICDGGLNGSSEWKQLLRRIYSFSFRDK